LTIVSSYVLAEADEAGVGANSVFRASASCSKILDDKKAFQYSEKFQGNSVFQGKRKLLKNSEYKKYIPYSENFQGNCVFQGKR